MPTNDLYSFAADPEFTAVLSAVRCKIADLESSGHHGYCLTPMEAAVRLWDVGWRASMTLTDASVLLRAAGYDMSNWDADDVAA